MKIKTFAERLNEVLISKGMKPTDLVNKTGLDKAAISQYLSGKYTAKQNNLTKLAKALNVNEAWLMGYDVDMKIQPNLIRANLKEVVIPVLGKVVAGTPTEVREEIMGYEKITKEVAEQGEHFGLVIKGNSMNPDFIENDIVIVRKQEDADSGSIAVILVDSCEATVKRIYKDVNGITLVPINSSYRPMFYSNKEIRLLPVQIIGKVIENRRKYY